MQAEAKMTTLQEGNVKRPDPFLILKEFQSQEV